MSSDDIRSSFLEFFKRKGHVILPSASLIPDDPQLMFTVAGMVPFKAIFWGKVEPVFKRVATVQKCLRTVDIDQVGRTPRHHTFFEMLGNFSFGDYFKREAIEFAWEYVTNVLKVPEDKLWVTIYEEDQDAYEIWKHVIGIPERKIIRMGKEDNFWGPAGPTGPCGPDSEIFYDTGITEYCDQNPEECDPSCGCGRFVEIWNLVFTEYYQDEDGKLHPLPRKNIDTGAGLERITAMMQNVSSNFETDLFKPIVDRIQEITGVRYGDSDESDISIRVIADHIRAIVFLISDGVFPSNEGRGYVLRRIIRRAGRHGWLLGMREPFLKDLVDSVVNKLGKVYPEIEEKRRIVKDVLITEERRFLKGLDSGMRVLENILEKSKDSGIIDGEDAFKLYDTYGFPLELTIEIARERGLKVDVDGFNRSMEKQRKMARMAREEVEFAKISKIYRDLEDKIGEVVFTGYEKFEDDSTILTILKDGVEVDSAEEKDEVEFVFRRTPFYPERGGQVSDTGLILSDDSQAEVFYVFSPTENLILHRARILKGKFRVGDDVKLKVDEKRRLDTMRNHTATHLLHSALRRILGDHVKQAGSLVAPDRLRFDFTHHRILSEDELRKIEELVNEKILESIQVDVEYKTLDEAKKLGAIALFEEKYGEYVRVVKIGDFSMELCGGTHVKNTSELGFFMITHEGSISSGVRRIEAVTGRMALRILEDMKKVLKNLSKTLEVGWRDVPSKLEKIMLENRNLKKRIREMEEKMISSAEAVHPEIEEISKVKILKLILENSDDSTVRNTADVMMNRLKSGVVIIFNKKNGRISFVVKLSEDLTKFLDASIIAREMAKILGGGGGGRKDFAQAGGKYPDKLSEAFEKAKTMIMSAIG